MGNCKDCKHWEDEHPNSPGRRMCRQLSDSGSVDTIDGMATIHTTTPEFGCVLFEAKTVETAALAGCPDERGHDLEGGAFCVYCGLSSDLVEAQTQKP